MFIITIGQRNMATQAVKNGKLFLVDLAGSEMVLCAIVRQLWRARVSDTLLLPCVFRWARPVPRVKR